MEYRKKQNNSTRQNKDQSGLLAKLGSCLLHLFANSDRLLPSGCP